MLAVTFGGWSGLEGSGDWGKVPATIPVIIFSLVYHDLAPGIRFFCLFHFGELVPAFVELATLTPPM